jgi:hypothetical protein
LQLAAAFMATLFGRGINREICQRLQQERPETSPSDRLIEEPLSFS